MKLRSIVIAFGMAVGIPALPAMAAETLLKFERGIGVDPVAGVSGEATVTVVNGVTTTTFPNVVRNDVRGVAPGGRHWVIARLDATVSDDGTLSATGEGLLLAGGDGIGTTGSARFVGASLFCGTQRFDSGAFALAPNGNFVIGGSLNAVPPNPCATPVLLIRNATSGENPGPLSAWFAAGIPVR